jgi:predicted MFS family arabinose efflux permease
MVRRLRRRGVIRLASAVVAFGCTAFALGGAYTPVTMVAILVTGIGGSLLVSSANPLLDDHHGAHGSGHGAAALAEGNAIGSACGLVAPLLVGAGLAAGLTWRPAILLTVPLAAAAWLMAGRQPAGVVALDDPGGITSGTPAPLPGAFWAVFGMLVALVGVEFCMSAWSAELLRTRTGMSSGAAAAGVAAIVAGMTLGRVLTGRVALHRPARPLLLAAILVCLAGWAITWVSTSPLPALVGLGVTGLGMAAHYPLGASLAMDGAAGQRDRASGLLSIGVGLSAGAGPFAIGALSDATSTHTAFLVVPVLLAAGLGLLLVAGHQARTPA